MVDTDIRSFDSFMWSTRSNPTIDQNQAEHGGVALPRVVLRRLDCALASTKYAVVCLAEEAGA